MAMMPKRVKWRKSQRGKLRGKAVRGNTVSFGEYGLQSLEPSWITARQIEAGRVAATHFLHRESKVYIRIFPHKSISSKPLETRMGKGKASPAYWVAVVRRGRILVEIDGVARDVAREVLSQAAYKLPIRTRVVERMDLEELR